jgi:hypothetical protein
MPATSYPVLGIGEGSILGLGPATDGVPYEAELRGLVFGCEAGDELAIRSFAGLGGPELVSAAREFSGRDGSTFQGADRASRRQITLEGRIHVDTALDAESRLRQVVSSWGAPVRSGTERLRLRVAGIDYYLYGRPGTLDANIEDIRYGVVRTRMPFLCSDPRLFTTEVSALLLGLDDGGGFVAPVTFPYASTGAEGTIGDGTAVNIGTADTPWVATITGPVDNPRLTLGATGETVELIGSVPDGATLVVDAGARTVRLDGASRPTWLTLASRWWELPAGTSSTVRFRASSGTGTLNLTWSSAWL